MASTARCGAYYGIIGYCFMIVLYPSKSLADCSGYIDLVLVVDSSESIMEHDPYASPGFHWSKLQEIFSKLVTSLPVDTGHTKISLLTYSSTPNARFGLDTHHTRPFSMQQAIMSAQPEAGFTDTAHALFYTAQHMFNGDRQDAPNVVVLVTDGLSNRGRTDTVTAALSLRHLRRAELYTVAITPYVDWEELKDMASSQQHVLTVNVDDVPVAVDTLTSRLCNVSTVPPTPSPKPCELRTDVVLIADNSGSIEIENYPVLQQFLVSLVDSLVVGSDQSQIGLVRFSEFAHIEFYLDTYSNNQDVITAIWNMPYDGAGTNIAAGIGLARSVFAHSGDRPDVRNVAIVITDGHSNIQEGQVEQETQLAKAEGVSFFVVGITGSVNEDELRGIASPPLHDHYFSSPDLQHLHSIRDTLATTVCYSHGGDTSQSMERDT